MDGSTHHGLLFIKILAVQDKTNLIITLLIALLINFNDPAWSPGLGLQNHHHIYVVSNNKDIACPGCQGCNHHHPNCPYNQIQ